MNTPYLIQRMARNKHTNLAGIAGFLCAAVAMLWPEYEDKAWKLFNLAVLYGLFNAQDAPKPPPRDDRRQRKLPLPLVLCGSLAVVCLCNGCVSTAGLVKALAKDPAAVSAEIITPWGQTRLTRIGAQTNSIAIKPGEGELNRK